jgi:flagellar motor switch protein FliM
MPVNDLLTEAEINALLYGIESNNNGNSTNDQDPSKYLKNTQFIQNYIPEIDIICERYIVFFRKFLRNFLHQNIEISINNVLLEKYIDYINSLSVPSSLNLLSDEKGDIKLFLNLDTNLGYLVIDNYFGGNGKYLSKLDKQEFSKLEYNVLYKAVNNAVLKLEESWEPIHPMKLTLVDTIYDLQSKNTLQADEIIGIIRFKTESGSIEGYFDLIIPHSTMCILKTDN